LVFRTVDNSGNSSSAGPYGPYAGWFPSAFADGSDGRAGVLWNNLDGSAALWLVDSQGGNQASYRLGPVQGWTAVDVAAAASGSHVLWTHSDNRIGLWTVDD